MATKSRNRRSDGAKGADGEAAPVRSFWSGTITFGLVSIPVDLYSAVRPRQTSMKLVDKRGHALGRQYHCSEDGRKLSSDDLVRGYETDSGKVVVITDEEFESVAPEMSRDIELRTFAPLGQIPPIYYQRPYYLAPAGGSAKAYNLLAQTMERTGRAAIGSFVMRGREYLTAILSENGVLRAETLRYADEIRTPDYVGLPKRTKRASRKVQHFVKDIERLTQNRLEMSELEDREAQALQELAQSKLKSGKDIIEQRALDDEEPEAGGASVVDLMEVLRKSLSKDAIVTKASNTPPAHRDARPARSPAHRQRASKRASVTRKSADDDLAHSSRSALMKVAADLHVSGRSKMDKQELVRAIRRAG